MIIHHFFSRTKYTFISLACFIVMHACASAQTKQEEPDQTPAQSTKEKRIPKEFNRITKKLYQKVFKPKKIEPKPEKKVAFEKDPRKDQLLKKTIRDMTIEQLTEAKDYARELGDKDLVLKYAERMVMITNDLEQLRSLRLEIPDLHFDNGDMKSASKLYRKYVEFYPGGKGKSAEQRDYALYKAVLCRFYARLKPPLDQSKTRKTISLANIYLNRTDSYKKYTDEIFKIRKDCYTDLYEYEMDIVSQYLNLDKLTAAQTRLESIKEEFLPIMGDIEPKLIELEGLVAQKQGKEAVMVKKMEELSKKFPAYNTTLLVAHAKPKKDYVSRF